MSLMDWLSWLLHRIGKIYPCGEKRYCLSTRGIRSPPKLKVGNSNPSGWVGARDGLTIFCKIPIDRLMLLISPLYRNPRDLSPDSKVHGANMGPTWGRQVPDGSHIGPTNLAIWVSSQKVVKDLTRITCRTLLFSDECITWWIAYEDDSCSGTPTRNRQAPISPHYSVSNHAHTINCSPNFHHPYIHGC